ncbi:MAG: protein XRP2, partial [Trebouxia sp. A1-2]
MGCIFSGSRSRASLYRVEAESPDQTVPPQAFSWDRADRSDAKDFVYKDLMGQTKVKPPGSIQGQQFIVDSCENCSIYLFDNSASVNIDDCNNCCIFVGPVDGRYTPYIERQHSYTLSSRVSLPLWCSLFVRDCRNCTIITVCRQFRTRDCIDCKCMLACGTKPIIEASSNIKFGCFDVSYKGLIGVAYRPAALLWNLAPSSSCSCHTFFLAAAQLETIGLSRFQNFWSDVYDFTPGTGHWDFLPL